MPATLGSPRRPRDRLSAGLQRCSGRLFRREVLDLKQPEVRHGQDDGAAEVRFLAPRRPSRQEHGELQQGPDRCVDLHPQRADQG